MADKSDKLGKTDVPRAPAATGSTEGTWGTAGPVGPSPLGISSSLGGAGGVVSFASILGGPGPFSTGLRDSPIFTGTNTSSFAAPGGLSAFGRTVLDEDEGLRAKYKALDGDISQLKKKFEEQAVTLRREQATAKEKEKRIGELEATLKMLQTKERLGMLLDSVNSQAKNCLLEPGSFLEKKFFEESHCSAFVMSVDIRRSTELMLKARSPELFAGFIIALCGDLIEIIKRNYGVFDKFTGDGVLAFFPDFYSGPDAAYLTLATADQCHAAFKGRYHEFRKSFKTVLKDVGLGIGIDYGMVHLVQMGPGFTVVGEPVVYACRFSGAPAGHTYLNQPAYEQLSDGFGGLCFTDEKELVIKHEGGTVAYSAKLNGRPHPVASPEWLNSQREKSTG